MTTVRQATREHVAPSRRAVGDGPPASRSGPGQYSATTRQTRRHEQRRRIREELIAVLVLAVLLTITLVLLGLQWLQTGSAPSASGLPHLLGGLA